MKHSLFIACLVGLLAAQGMAQNLVANGDFEKWNGNEPVGWHSKITGVITISEYKDPEKKKGLLYKHFKDGCGYDWGKVRPWVGLFCPQCKQMITTEESSDWYVKNFERVMPVNGPSGKAAGMKMDAFVGSNQGVRLCSDFIKAERGAGYEFGVDAITNISLQLFVECFAWVPEDKEAAEWAKTLPPEVNPMKHPYRLKRVFREHIYPAGAATWTHFHEQFVAPKRYQFDVMYVSLYSYSGTGAAGESGFDNVYIRKLSAAEMAAYARDNPPPKDERFR